jgi:general secretion pathway protein J
MNMKSGRGFTLVELLIAISVLAIVAVLGWRGLDSIVRARVALNADLDQTRGLQLAFAQMQSDASHIASTASIGNRRVLDARAGSLTLVRTVFADNQPSRVQVVAYRVRDGVLTRRESIATRDLKELDASWSAAMGDTDSSQPVVLQSGVSRMAVRTWDGESMAWRTGSDASSVASGTGSDPGIGGSGTGGSSTGSNTGGQPASSATGLEVALQLQDRPTDMVKVFLLGAV